MRIAWVGPFAAGSADARYGFLTVQAFEALGHTAIVFRTDTAAGSESQPFAGEIVPAEALTARSDVDIVYYALNDHFGSYGQVYALLRARPGIVIFLSWFLYNYFRGFMAAAERGVEVPGIIEDLYGPGSFLDEIELMKLPLNDALREIDRAHPMGEWVARHALGGVAHAHFYLDKLRTACPGPVTMAPLAYRSDPLAPLPAKPQLADGPRVLLTLGVMNANKRVESVIRTLGATPRLRETLEYRCVGAIGEAQRGQWSALAESLGVRVSFSGHVEEAVMRRSLEEADIIACLRDPPLEGGSGSVLESMLSGRPVVVTRTGCYLDLPDDTVLKVDPDREEQSLAAHLLALLDDAEMRHRIGAAAQAWVRRSHAPAGYAQALLEFAGSVLRFHSKAEAA